MLVETLMSLAGPWPLKIILDNVVGSHHLPKWLDDFVGSVSAGLGPGKMRIAAVAALIAVLIAVHWLARFLHRQLLHRKRGPVGSARSAHADLPPSRSAFRWPTTTAIRPARCSAPSPMTSRRFRASHPRRRLGILVDLLTIVGMLGLMFWLNWDFALMAVGVTPFLLLFVSRFKRAVKKATHEVRHRQADIVAAVQQGLESVRVVKAFGRQDLEQEELSEVSHATVDAALKARKVKSMLSPVVTVTVALCTAFVLWRGASLILIGTMTVGALTVFLSYLNKFFKPVQDLAKMTNAIAQAAVGVERIQAILETDTIIPERPDAREPGSTRGEIAFDHVAFGYNKDEPGVAGRQLHHQAR